MGDGRGDRGGCKEKVRKDRRKGRRRKNRQEKVINAGTKRENDVMRKDKKP
jgi:hypothetical protein